MNIHKENLINLLNNEVELLAKSVTVLRYSFDQCRHTGLKNNYTMPELSEFESLSGRFARSSDILTQKVLKTLFILLQEDAKFFIDRMQLIRKNGPG